MQPNPQLKAALATITLIPGVSDADAKRMIDVIVENPYLLAAFNKAAASGALKSFTIEDDPWSAASYSGSDGTISVPPVSLQLPPKGEFNAMELTFLLGHEVQHANDPGVAAAYAQFDRSVKAIAASPAAVHDYTAPLTKWLEFRRDREGAAEISGFNAVHAALVAQGIPPTAQAMYAACPLYMDVFMDPDPPGGPRFNPGLRLQHDGSLQMVPGNVGLMNQLYFHGNDDGEGMDYLHRYARGPIQSILFADSNARLAANRAPARIVIDFGFLGLSADELYRAGVHIYPPQKIYDRPTDPSPSHWILPVPKKKAMGDDDAPLLAQARDGVARLDAQLGRPADEASEQLAQSAAALAHRHGFERIDHVVLSVATATAAAGERVFVVQGELDGQRRMADLPMRDALDPATPARLSVPQVASADAVAPGDPALRPAPLRA